MNFWVVILPDKYAKKYSQKLALVGITTISEKQTMKSIPKKEIFIQKRVTTIVKKAKGSVNDVKNIINKLTKTIGRDIPIADIIMEATYKKIDAEKVEECVEKLKCSGDILEPRSGFIQKL